MLTDHSYNAQWRQGESGARKHSRRSLLTVTFLSVLLVATGTNSADAYRGWCRADPQFLIAGDLVLVTINAQVRDLRTARKLSTGPIKIVLTVPSGTDARYLASNDGFGHGYDIVIEHSDQLQPTDQEVPVHVNVRVPMTDSTVPIRIAFMPAGSAEQSRSDEKVGMSAGQGRNNGVLTAGTATGTANDWIALTT